MKLVTKKLWEIIELAKSGDLNEIANSFLKDGLQNFYIKYVYDKDMDFIEFSKNFEEDINQNRIELLKIYDTLYKIFHLHRDIDEAIKFKDEKIKYMIENDIKGIIFEKYELANLFFDQSKYEHALETVNQVLKNIDTKNMSIKELELFVKSMIMQNQLKQNLKYNKDEILDDIKYLENIFLNTEKYFNEKKKIVIKVQILYLYLSYWLMQQEYAKAIVYGSKAVALLEENDVNIKISLRYRIYENLAYAYLLNKNFSQAIKMSKKAISLKNKLVSLDTFSALVILSESYLALGEYEEALNYAHEANGYVNNSLTKLEYIYELLAKIYKAKDNEESAVEYLEKLCKLQEAKSNSSKQSS